MKQVSEPVAQSGLVLEFPLAGGHGVSDVIDALQRKKARKSWGGGGQLVSVH